MFRSVSTFLSINRALFIMLVVSGVLIMHGVMAEKDPTRSPTQRPSNPIYGSFIDGANLSPVAEQVIMGLLIVLLFAGMIFDVQTPEVLFLGAVCVTLILQIITLEEALSGFSNSSMITIGALFIVVGGVESSHVVDWAARKTFGSDGSIFIGKVRMFCACFSMSIFFNNTPLVAILLPVVKDWARVRNIAASQLLIPLSYSVMAGSFVTMIGTSTNLTVQGLMQADRGYSFGFFDPAPFGFSLFTLLLIYQLICGPIILPKEQVGLFRTARDKADSLIAEVYVSPESPAVGRSLGEMLNALGLGPNGAIKIRRKLRPTRPASLDDLKVEGAKRSSNVLDWNYIKQSATSWAPSTMPTRRLSNAGEADASSGELDRAGDAATTTGQDSNTKKKPAATDNNGDGGGRDTSKDYIDIVVPQLHELIAAHDVIFLSSAQDVVEKMMKSIAGESAGLYILNSNALALPGYGTELLECVVSHQNPFLGMRVSQMLPLFAEKYTAGIITVRGKDWDKPAVPTRPPALYPCDTAAGSGSSGSHIVQQIKPFSTRHSRSEKHHRGEPVSQRSDDDNDNNDNAGIELEEMYSSVDCAEKLKEQRQISLSADIKPADESKLNDGDDSKANDDTALRDYDPETGNCEAATAAAAEENASSTSGLEAEYEETASNAGSVFSKLDPNVIKEASVSDHVLGYGDIILCVSNEKECHKLKDSKDFFVVSSVGSLPKPLDLYKMVPVFIFVVMLVLVATEVIEMPAASLLVAFTFFMGNWVKANEIPKLLDVRLLMLIGLSLSFAGAVTKSGLATTVANTISQAQSGPQSAIFLVYALTLVCTELVSNNAAAALMYPISVALADKMGVSFKPFAMIVLIAATSGFMSPIGYQTHLMVWGPGGYKFTDFLKFGFVPDIIYWIGASILVPLVFPF